MPRNPKLRTEIPASNKILLYYSILFLKYILGERFISYARKPQAFKPGDEWHPFGAKRRPFPGCLAWSKVMTDMVEA